MKKRVKKFDKCPDMTVNEAIMKFCSTSSSENLKLHLSNTKERSFPAEDWLKNLTEKMADPSASANLAGLGALAFAIFIDIVSGSSSSGSTKEDLRGVFAEEKASEVWDQIDECLKRYLMHMDDDAELVSSIGRLEGQLSAALTRLKNSMLKDGHMSSRALKAWVNGAAFHLHMLVHLVRLGGLQTCGPAERLVSVYQRDLQLLFEEHKAVVKKGSNIWVVGRFRAFFTEEGEGVFIFPCAFSEIFEVYYEECYTSQKQQITQYFSTVREDLPQLLRQDVSPELHLSSTCDAAGVKDTCC